MDRPGLDNYAAAKARIFQGDGVQVLNRDIPAPWPWPRLVGP